MTTIFEDLVEAACKNMIAIRQAQYKRTIKAKADIKQRRIV